MIQIIPAINAATWDEVVKKIRLVEPHVEWVHIDVADGTFTPNTLWHSPFNLAGFETRANVEIHLMVSEPDKVIDQWLVRPIRRVIVHLEAAKNLDVIIKKCREAGVEIGLAINPETFWGRFEPWFGKVEIYQTLAVHPGPSGQEADWPDLLGKIRHIRARCPSCMIEVDGGINPHTYKNAISAGANILVAGAFIFNSNDTSSAIDELRK